MRQDPESKPLHSTRRPLPTSPNSGLTLVELVMVILLVGLLATTITTRFDFLALYRKKGELRNFLNTWQYLLNEAAGDGNSYRFIIDIDRNSYLVRQEVPVPLSNVRQVDRARNLRLRSEQMRREQLENDQALSADETFRILDELEENLSLEELFAISQYPEPGRNVRLAIPVGLSGLAEEQFIAPPLKIIEVIVDGQSFRSGRVQLNFTSQGAGNVALVVFDLDGEVVSAVLNPLSGESKISKGIVDYQFIERGQQLERP
jgi:hypothetical protein